jgi:putative lipoic acid-binding regulatory protein
MHIPMSTPPPSFELPPDAKTLIDYPCRFPIKVMGERSDDFLAEMLAVAHRFDPDMPADSVEVRQSSGGKYQGLTLHVWVTSRIQLDDVYRALSGHPKVKVTL